MQVKQDSTNTSRQACSMNGGSLNAAHFPFIYSCKRHILHLRSCIQQKKGHTAVWGEFSEVVWFGKKPFNLSRMGGDWRDVVNDLSAGTIGGGLENVIIWGVRRLHSSFFSHYNQVCGIAAGHPLDTVSCSCQRVFFLSFRLTYRHIFYCTHLIQRCTCNALRSK